MSTEHETTQLPAGFAVGIIDTPAFRRIHELREAVETLCPVPRPPLDWVADAAAEEPQDGAGEVPIAPEMVAGKPNVLLDPSKYTLRRLTRQDGETVLKAFGKKDGPRMQALLCLAASISIQVLEKMDLSEVGDLLLHVAAREGVESDWKVQTLTDDEDRPWQTATSGQKAPFVARMKEIWDHLELSDDEFEAATGRKRLVPIDPPKPVAVYDAREPSMIIPLRFPFTFGDVRVDRIELWPPTIADVDAMLKDEIGREDVYARMANVSREILDALRWPDARQVLSCAAELVGVPNGRG